MNFRHYTLALLGLLSAGTAAGSDLSYTYVDFRVLNNSLDLTGTDTPVAGQTVGIETSDGDGISVAGSVQLPAGFYLAGSFNSSIIDVTSTITSPLTVAEVRDDFDLISSSFGIGYRHEIGENFDAIAELSYDTADLDFGSLAGEDFDTDGSGVAAKIGFRWNPRPPFELYALGGVSPVAEVSLNDRSFDSGGVVNAGFRWYFFQDLGFGLDYQSGDLSALTLSMRFSFGSVPW